MSKLPYCWWRLSFLVVSLSVLMACQHAACAAERTFLLLDRMCSPEAGGGFVFRPAKSSVYHEVIGSTAAKSMRLCTRSALFNFGCRKLATYNFRVACNGQLMSAPQFYLAYHGHDRPDAQVWNDQLSMIAGGSRSGRMQFPKGYAPLAQGSLDKQLVRIPWDEQRGWPLLGWTPTDEQARQIQPLFSMTKGYVDPFPAVHMARLAEIRDAKKVAIAAERTKTKGILLVAAFAMGGLVTVWALKRNLSIDTWAGKIAVSSLGGIISSAVLVLLDFKDTVVLLSAGFFYGVIVISLAFSVSSRV